MAPEAQARRAPGRSTPAVKKDGGPPPPRPGLPCLGGLCPPPAQEPLPGRRRRARAGGQVLPSEWHFCDCLATSRPGLGGGPRAAPSPWPAGWPTLRPGPAPRGEGWAGPGRAAALLPGGPPADGRTAAVRTEASPGRKEVGKTSAAAAARGCRSLSEGHSGGWGFLTPEAGPGLPRLLHAREHASTRGRALLESRPYPGAEREGSKAEPGSARRSRVARSPWGVGLPPPGWETPGDRGLEPEEDRASVAAVFLSRNQL